MERCRLNKEPVLIRQLENDLKLVGKGTRSAPGCSLAHSVGTQQEGHDVSVTTSLFGTTPGVIGRPGEMIDGTEAGEWIIGTEDDDIIAALGGDDFVQALAGADEIDAGDGNDTVLGGEDDETIEGGTGDDVLRGDAGADTFVFSPSGEEGADVIVDFTPEDGDVIALSAAGLADAGLGEFSGAALDENEAFNIVEDAESGDLVIEHPGGTVTLNGVPFAEEGQEPPTFAELEAAGLLTVAGLVQGTDGGEELPGTEGDDVIDAGDGDDTITPLGGDDTITTGGGSDSVNLDPSNPGEGDDVITDFTAPGDPVATEGDTINFALEDVLAADPDVAAADGDATTLSLADFDASENWTLDPTEDGDALLIHPNGSVELVDVAAGDLEFADLAAMITIDGEEFSEPIPVDDGADGDDGTDGDGVADGDDGTDGDDDTDGDDVADGDDGTDDDGADGDDGTDGDDVADGDDGTDGDDADGDDGTDGDDVADGDDGTDGDDAAGDDGTDGDEVADGDDGTDDDDDVAGGDDDVAGDEDGADGEEDMAQAASPDPMEDAIA
jgi:RTX calcium-binding nonapeptide repeat (4 copies)